MYFLSKKDGINGFSLFVCLAVLAAFCGATGWSQEAKVPSTQSGGRQAPKRESATVSQYEIPNVTWSLPQVLMEIDAIVNDSSYLDNQLSLIRVKGRAADLIWPYRPDAARQLLKDLSMEIARGRLAANDLISARRVVLGVLFRRDPKTAGALAGGSPASNPGNAQPELQNQIAADLLESSPEAAARLLKQTVPQNPSREGLSLLSQLRSRNAELGITW